MGLIRMEKITKTYRFEKDIIDHAENNIKIQSFAQWANDRYRKEFLNIEIKAAQLQEVLQQAEQLKAEIRELKQQEAKPVLREQEIRWFQRASVKRIERSTFEGVYKWFVHGFRRPEINRRQFKIFIDQYGKKAQNSPK